MAKKRSCPSQKEWLLSDVLTLCENDAAVYTLLKDKDILLPAPQVCHKCGHALKPCRKNGRPALRCTWNQCKTRCSMSTGSFLEDYRLRPRDWLLVVYFWSHKVPFTAIQSMTGFSPTTVAKIVTQLQTTVMHDCKVNPPVIGGPGTVVEIDETEVGRKKKGVLSSR